MKVTRFSGYTCSDESTVEVIKRTLNSFPSVRQLHIDTADIVDDRVLTDTNCDLALLEKCFLKNDCEQYSGKAVSVGSTYKHFKGKTVKVLSVAKYSEDPTKMFVVYDCGDNGIYARPYDMFISEVDKEKYPDCEQMYRFEIVPE